MTQPWQIAIGRIFAFWDIIQSKLVVSDVSEQLSPILQESWGPRTAA